MRKELKINNSKNIIIGIFILFCTIILIIGGTHVFFNDRDSKEIKNIVSTGGFYGIYK